MIHYDARRPLSKMIEATKGKTGIGPLDIQRPQTTCSLFVPSPRPLEQHLKPHILFYPNKKNAEWLFYNL